ncbi:hypothetical protein Tsubulata_024196 [Turnera subulata]|uniref:Uncharacterized protein n=1 Tax=Turnera subulata TaxID=218843 RepID=A0A9Q0G1R6_9ROSI|nr:hypothetical protein Tsubulata_024196 [Turnera subulata]
MAEDCRGKSLWPELLGGRGKAAEKKIEKENPYVDARIVLDGSFVTQEFSCTRVWVWVDKEGIVTRVPKIG